MHMLHACAACAYCNASSLSISICMHCTLLQTPDEDAALKAIKLAFDNGVNFFDVAPFYAAGKAEEVRSEQANVLLLNPT